MDNKWNTDLWTCNIGEKIEKCHQIIAFNLNKKRLYGDGSAMSFNKFVVDPKRPGEIEAIEQAFQLFLNDVEVAARVAQGKAMYDDDKKKKGKKGKKGGNKKRKGAGANGRTVRPLEDDEADEGSDSEAGSDKEDGSDSENAEDNSEERKIDLFIEPVIHSKAKPDSVKNARDIVTDYRFWAVSYSEKVDFNKIHRKNIEVAIEYNEAVLSGKKRKNQVLTETKAYERWKLIKNKAQVARLADNYYGIKHACKHLGVVEAKQIDNSANPISATSMFNPYVAFFKTDLNAKKEQSEVYWKRYFDSAEDNTKKITFPFRKFVYRVPLSDMKVKTLYNRLFLDQQQSTVNQFIKLLDVILGDPNVFDFEDKASEASLNRYLDENLDQAADASVSPQQARRNNRAGEDEEEREVNEDDDPFGEHLFDDMEEEMNNTGSSSPASQSDDGANTRRNHLAKMAEFFNFPLFDKKDLKPVNKSDVIQRIDMVDLLSSQPDINYLYASAYTPIAMVSHKNLNKIRTDLKNPKSELRRLKNAKLVARKLYLFNQEAAIREYKNSCRSPDCSGLSPAGRRILEEVQKGKLYERHGIVHEKFCKELNNFVTQECRLYDQYDQIYMVNSQHRIVSLAHKNSLDAYCVNFKRPHQNLLSQEPVGGKGKSFAWGLLMDHMRIQNTVEYLTYETIKSRATDETNMNDNVVIFDEMEKEMISKDAKGSGSDKERSMKQLLANNKVCAKVLFIDDQGRRKTKVTYSECITVFFGSTNSDTSCMSSSMARRWHITYLDERFTTTRTILEMKMAELARGAEEKAFTKKIDREHHIYQALVFEIEKLIHIGVLEDVSMHVGMIMTLYLSYEMHKAGIQEPNPSMFERAVTTYRINCILDAIDKVFFMKGAKYEGKDIQVDYLKDLDRHLFVNAQHVVSAWGELLDILINGAELVVKQAVRHIHSGSEGKTSRFKLIPSNSFKEIEQEDGKKIRVPDSKNLDGNYVVVSLDSQDKYHQYRTLAQKIYKEIPKIGMKKDEQEEDNIFNPMDGKAKKNKKIDEEFDKQHKKNKSAGQQQEEEDRPTFRPSVEVIESILKQWGSRQIYSKNYKYDQKSDKSICDKDSKEKLVDVAHVYKNQLRIHYKFLYDSGDKTPEKFIEDVVQDIFSRRHQLPHTFVFCPDDAQPHIRRLIKTKGPEKGGKAGMLNIPSVVQIKEIEKKILDGIENYIDLYRQCEYMPIDTDLDTYGLMQRNETLFICKDRIHKGQMRENPLDKLFAGEDEQLDDPFDSANYDDNVGYFMGVRLDKLFVDDTKGLELFDQNTIKQLYDELDVLQPVDEDELEMAPDDIDVDFAFSDYIVYYKDPQNKSGPVYHWDIIAQTEAKVQCSKKKKESLAGASFRKPDPKEMLKMDEETAEKYKQSICLENARKYKELCVHPVLIDQLANLRFYRDAELYNYPEDMIKKASKSRLDRWNTAKELLTSDEDIQKAILSDMEAKENNENQRFTFLSYKIMNNKLYRDPENSYCVVENVLLSLFPDSPTTQKDTHVPAGEKTSTKKSSGKEEELDSDEEASDEETAESDGEEQSDEEASEDEAAEEDSDEEQEESDSEEEEEEEEEEEALLTKKHKLPVSYQMSTAWIDVI